jgi:hypothetical protein
MGLMSSRKEDARVISETLETLLENGGVGQDTSGGTTIDDHPPPSRIRIVEVYGLALLLALALFYLHVVVIFDVIGEMLRYKAWLLEHMGPKDSGKVLLLGCFFALMSAHATQAAASITTLGYGDILLTNPWRHLGTLVAITGALMFGCSTAFLFVILQAVWRHF